MTTNDEDDEFNLWSREETDELDIPLTEDSLRLRQFGSHDKKWGIHSCVWDGGIGTLAYLIETEKRRDMLLVDVGAGTGIVGLGLAKLGATAILSDLAEATPLLEENKRLNGFQENVLVMELAWGGKSLPKSLVQHLQSAKNVLVVGADVIYRPQLLDPLIATLKLLLKECSQRDSVRSTTRCVIGTHSTRTQLQEFYKRARTAGLVVDFKANVSVPSNALDPRCCRVDLGDSSLQDVFGVIHISEVSLQEEQNTLRLQE